MAELLSPGIFIEERPSPVQQVLAVGTSNFATIGWTPKGPENTATLVTSIEQFFNKFGGFNRFSDLAYGVVGYFNNGGTRAYVVRVCPNDALLAQADLATNYRFKAISRGAWGNNLRISLSGNSNYYDLATATYSKFSLSVLEESANGEGDFNIVETFDVLSLTDPNAADYIASVINDEINGSEYIRVEVLAGGIPAALQSTSILNEVVGSGDGITQQFNYTLANLYPAKDTIKISLSGTLVAQDNGEGILEQVSGSVVTGTIDYETGAIEIFFASAPTTGQIITADYYQAPAVEVVNDLVGGSDGTPSTIGRNQISASSLMSEKKGLYAFDDIDEFLNLGIMDFAGDKEISLDALAYAKKRKDVFVVLDCGAGKNPQQAIKYKKNVLNSLSDYGAIYYPRIKVADELNNGRPKVISPVGHIIGRYAYTDTVKNVGKTPAGMEDGQLNGVLELERKVSQGERDSLYPASINPLREDNFVGKAIWGAKTLAITGDFTRINARRLFIFLEKSVFNSTHDFVFENIGPQTWARIKLRLDGFFNVLFNDGYFRGNTPEEAFRIVVDESNNPPAIVNARTIIVDVYVSVSEPGEFIRIRFQRSFPTT